MATVSTEGTRLDIKVDFLCLSVLRTKNRPYPQIPPIQVT